ncbi:MAG: hypothetical protein QOG73_4802 [Acetobacteraceae bacterium]|nr:hypothetical protein [Acetobacteraceae bacterium]
MPPLGTILINEFSAMANDDKLDSVAVAMHKLRILYHMTPETSTLRSAHDAAGGMRMSVNRLTKRSSSKGGYLVI